MKERKISPEQFAIEEKRILDSFVVYYRINRKEKNKKDWPNKTRNDWLRLYTAYSIEDARRILDMLDEDDQDD